MSSIIETPSKVAAAHLAGLEVKDKESPSLLSKMQDTLPKATSKPMTKGEGRVFNQIEMDDGHLEQHVSTIPRGKFVGDLSITDDSMEPLLQETEQRFVLFPIQYHDVGVVLLCLHSLSVYIALSVDAGRRGVDGDGDGDDDRERYPYMIDGAAWKRQRS
jgi:hypothetical protein